MNFTAEQVREMAVNVRDCGWPDDVKEYMVLIEPMLTAYVDSIERAQAHAELYKSACDSVEEWKARALKAERIAERLGDSLNDMTGPTFMGEPVLSRPVTQGEAVQLEAAIKRAARKRHG